MGEPAKLDFYLTRTVEHIHRVQRNMLTLVTRHRGTLDLTVEDCRELMWNVMNHDRSKFSTGQFDGYIELTEYFRQRKVLGNGDYDYPVGVREHTNAAVANHYAVENHHPEMHPVGTLGKWTRHQAIECACDLQAMAEEYNEGSCRGFWKNVWLPRYRKQSGFFDDYNWQCIQAWMRQVIECFEKDMIPVASGSSEGDDG